MFYLKLTEIGGEDVYINFENVFRYTKVGVVTNVIMSSDEWVSVKETPEQITKMLPPIRPTGGVVKSKTEEMFEDMDKE